MRPINIRISFPVFGLILLFVLARGSYAQVALNVLPLGNSITRGSMCLNGTIYPCERLGDAESIGYRHRLYNLMSGAGYNIDFLGNHKYGYDLMSDPDNAGFSGIRDNSLADIMETGYSAYTGQVTPGPYLEYFPADIILLHIGSNDVLAGDYNTVYDVTRILDAIDDYETEFSHPILVFIARIISLKNKPCGTDYGINQFNSRLISMVNSRINNGDLLVLVDMECGAGIDYYNDIIDEVHPNQVGYDKMADRWFQVIDGYNAAPVVKQIPNQTVDRGSAFTQILLDSYVTDAEDNPQDISWSVYPSSPQHFQVTINANRVATITANDPYWSGSETIEFVATDQGRVVQGLQKTDNCLTTFTVNWTPEIIGQESITISQSSQYEITLDDLTIVEPEKAPTGLQVVVLSGSDYTRNGNTITPHQGFVGDLTVPVKVVAGGKESNLFELTIQVVRVNFPPVITSTPVTSARTNEQYLYPVEAEDPDPEDVLYYSAIQKPGWMQVNPSTGLVYGVPSANDTGGFDITLKVTDGELEDTQSYRLEVVNVNHPPEFLSVPPDTALIDETYTYGVQASDADGDPLTYFANTLPGWLEFYPQSKVLIGVPGYGDAGNHLVILAVSDATDTAYQAFTIYVNSLTGAPSVPSGEAGIYPNPASEYITVELPQIGSTGDRVEFELYDLTGRVVLRNTLYDPVSTVHLEKASLVAGVYFYRLTAASGHKIIDEGKIVISPGGM